MRFTFIEVVYLVLYILAFVCFALATAGRRAPATPPRWNLIAAGLALVVLVRIIQLIDANTTA